MVLWMDKVATSTSNSLKNLYSLMNFNRAIYSHEFTSLHIRYFAKKLHRFVNSLRRFTHIRSQIHI